LSTNPKPHIIVMILYKMFNEPNKTYIERAESYQTHHIIYTTMITFSEGDIENEKLQIFIIHLEHYETQFTE
jgi:hypothetical protein